MNIISTEKQIQYRQQSQTKTTIQVAQELSTEM
jgi:hypothetical protein